MLEAYDYKQDTCTGQRPDRQGLDGGRTDKSSVKGLKTNAQSNDPLPKVGLVCAGKVAKPGENP